MYNYFFGVQEKYIENLQTEDNGKIMVNEDFIKVGFVSVVDLKSINLHPIKYIEPIKNKESIMIIKLKPIPKIEKNIIYEPRHPCLRELLNKFKKVNS